PRSRRSRAVPRGERRPRNDGDIPPPPGRAGCGSRPRPPLPLHRQRARPSLTEVSTTRRGSSVSRAFSSCQVAPSHDRRRRDGTLAGRGRTSSSPTFHVKLVTRRRTPDTVYATPLRVPTQHAQALHGAGSTTIRFLWPTHVSRETGECRPLRVSRETSTSHYPGTSPWAVTTTALTAQGLSVAMYRPWDPGTWGRWPGGTRPRESACFT